MCSCDVLRPICVAPAICSAVLLTALINGQIAATLNASKDMPECSGGDKIRLICMGKGMLSPDSKTLEGCSVPVFKTHPTPVNVAVRPENIDLGSSKKGSPKKGNPGSAGGGGSGANGASAPQPGSSGCACVIL